MKVITKYQADDGTEFNSKLDCMKHEVLCEKIQQIMALLPKRPDDMEFANGHGYVQHAEKSVIQFRNRLLALMDGQIDHPWVGETRQGKAHPSYLARLLDDSASPLGAAWNRLLMIDKKFREWGQPYYAMHPDRGEQTRLNP